VPYSAVQYVRDQLGLQVCAIARLADLLHYLSTADDASALAGAGALSMQVQHRSHHGAVMAYRDRYGVA
jgi:orotate phosphoribosyltransferase